MALVADDSQKNFTKKLLLGVFDCLCYYNCFYLFRRFHFKVFGITIVSFRIAGGILVAVIGYHMINGNHSPSYKGMGAASRNSDPMSIAISPLAMPLLQDQEQLQLP